ncbi:hypothetical protein ACC713_37485, partial [Rhizobium johnstonii]|uniref:hypothetical protein n=1 Tax=Rhizobium johnstonii TaxID=3019933 RepID=UPI003F9E5C6A
EGAGACFGKAALTRYFSVEFRRTITGATTVSAGTLQLMSVNAVPATSPLEVRTGEQLKMAGFNQAFASLTGNGNILLGNEN